MEYRTLRLGVMILGQNCMLLAVGTTNHGAVAVLAFRYPAGTNTGQPRDLMGMLQIRRAQNLPAVGACSAQQPLEVHTGDHVGELAIMILFVQFGIKGFHAGSQNYRPHLDLHLFLYLIEINGVRLAHGFADLTFFFLQVKTAFINISNQGNGLGEIDMDGLVLRYLLIVDIGINYRAILHTNRTPRTFVLDDVSWFSLQRYLEISHLSRYTINFRVSQDLDIWMPADLDQFGCKNSHGAVIGGEGLIQLGHMTPDAGRLLHQVYLETRRGQIE
ncbi:MAG: hypothetical protein A4E66_01833 [Syntrophus sp. PtaB.Bin001]|nr:MAG: hypothetical protein A4E66_01833 [Syntrophus sp. PtaB.Bin001]